MSKCVGKENCAYAVTPKLLKSIRDDSYDLGYNNAINEFLQLLEAERTQCYNFDDEEHINPIKCVWWEDISKIAEQLKRCSS